MLGSRVPWLRARDPWTHSEQLALVESGFAGSHFLFAPTIGYDELAAIEASYIRKTN